jgi:hypothetical protein
MVVVVVVEPPVVVVLVLPVFFGSSPQPTIMPKLNSKTNAKNFFIFSSLKIYCNLNFSPEPFRRHNLDTGH